MSHFRLQRASGILSRRHLLSSANSITPLTFISGSENLASGNGAADGCIEHS